MNKGKEGSHHGLRNIFAKKVQWKKSFGKVYQKFKKSIISDTLRYFTL